MKKAINRETIIGRIYDKSNLAEKVTGENSKNPGTKYIGGSLDIATDDAGLNVITVYFTYVVPTYSSGKTNNSYGVLENIIKNGKTVLNDGAEAATLVKVDASLGLNDFYTNRDGQETLVSAKRNMGSFINTVSKLGEESTRNTFECDMLINGTKLVEADGEKVAEDYLVVKGAVFDFKGAILPVEFVVKNKSGIKYFESLDASASNLTFTKVWGQINSETIVSRREEESAFGEPAVKEYTKTVREWVITGTSKPDLTYEIGDEENGITNEEIKKALADREVMLADVKKRADEYQASKTQQGFPFADGGKAVTAAEGGFNF